MISKKYKCVFIHIPKCAGMSVEHLLGANLQKFHKKSWQLKHGGPKAPCNKKFFQNPEYFKFTIVRNPWDRAVSAFFHDVKMCKTNPSVRRLKARSLFKKYGIEGFNEFIKIINIKKLSRQHSHYRRQTPFLDAKYDYICRFENINKDIKFVCDKLGIDFKRFEHKNKSLEKEKAHYSDFYSEKSIELIHDIYEEDINKLNYTFNE